jgi:hypothetical protein
VTASRPQNLQLRPADQLDAFTRHLDGGLAGRLLTPTDPEWDETRSPWQLAVDQQPVAIVVAGTADDVVATVRAAAAAGLRVAPQCTGHNAAPLGPLDGTVLLRTSGMRGVSIDPDQRVARVGAGVVWGEVTAAAAEHGLAGALGSAADIGVVGYTLGGGVSWFARELGLAANHVLAVEIVTADGVLRRVDAEHEPELFWAVRGGGGSFGVVTALEFRLFPLTEVEAGALYWPIERAGEVLHAWRAWTADLPESVTSLGRLLRVPPIPEMPEPVRGRSFVVVELVSLAGPEATGALLARLRELGPEMDTVATVPVTALFALHMDPPMPVPAVGDGIALRELTTEALDAFLAAVGPRTPHPPLLTAEIRHLGGAARRSAPGGGAVSALDVDAVVFSGTIAPVPEAAAAAHSTLDALAAALAPWTAESTYLNMVERAGTAVHPAAALPRLRAVKGSYDADDVIRANHPVAPFPERARERATTARGVPVRRD